MIACAVGHGYHEADVDVEAAAAAELVDDSLVRAFDQSDGEAAADLARGMFEMFREYWTDPCDLETDWEPEEGTAW
jgi:hypothetical protein